MNASHWVRCIPDENHGVLPFRHLSGFPTLGVRLTVDPQTGASTNRLQAGVAPQSLRTTNEQIGRLRETQRGHLLFARRTNSCLLGDPDAQFSWFAAGTGYRRSCTHDHGCVERRQRSWSHPSHLELVTIGDAVADTTAHLGHQPRSCQRCDQASHRRRPPSSQRRNARGARCGGFNSGEVGVRQLPVACAVPHEVRTHVNAVSGFHDIVAGSNGLYSATPDGTTRLASVLWTSVRSSRLFQGTRGPGRAGTRPPLDGHTVISKAEVDRPVASR